MTPPARTLLLQSAPFLRRGLTTPRLMLEVAIGLAPVALAAIFFFGVSAVLVLVSAIAGAVVTEWLLGRGRAARSSLLDNSAMLTGAILALTLPPAVPMWMAFLGGAISIGLGKALFGGLGQNLFNPALIGRAFLQAAFPTVMTTWSAQSSGGDWWLPRAGNLALPFMRGGVDAVTTATPLGLMKFEKVPTELAPLLLGNTAGSLGETCAVLILACGIVMALRRLFDWRIPVAILLSVAVLSSIPWLLNRAAYPSPLFMLTSGGLLFGAVYMATDPVTSPVTPRGAWLFGAGVGALVVLIRLWGGLPEGVMYSILLMNAVAPLIERFTQPRGFGHGVRT